MSLPQTVTRFATLITFAGTIALTYVCSADPQMELTAAPPVATAPKEISAARAVSRGSIKLGGSLSTSASKDNDSMLTVAPSMMYFPLDRVAIGLEGNFGWDRLNLMNRSLRPSLSYYLYAANSLAVFVKQDVGFNSYKGYAHGGDLDGPSDYSFVDASTKLGLDWFLNQNVAVTPMIGASYGNGESGGTRYVGSVAFTVYL